MLDHCTCLRFGATFYVRWIAAYDLSSSQSYGHDDTSRHLGISAKPLEDYRPPVMPSGAPSTRTIQGLSKPSLYYSRKLLHLLCSKRVLVALTSTREGSLRERAWSLVRSLAAVVVSKDVGGSFTSFTKHGFRVASSNDAC